MCTLTFVPTADGVLFTTNRDEGYNRKLASPPDLQIGEKSRFLCPIDGQAGGTWIGVTQSGKAICLLNGGRVKHRHSPPYRLSRGIIVRDLLSNDQLVLSESQLDGIEPFTLFAVDASTKTFLRFIWNGTSLDRSDLAFDRPMIACSSTLFDQAGDEKRQRWFEQWQRQNARVTPDDVLQFHMEAGKGDDNDSVLLKREEVGTVSVTSIFLSSNQAEMRYVDLQQQKHTIKTIAIHANGVQV